MVISLIGLVAGLIVAAAASASIKAKTERVRTELGQLETAIEHYKLKLGYFPPDNPGNRAVNQLFYELTGTTNDSSGSTFYTFNGRTITAGAANSAFARKSFANCSADKSRVQNFFPTIKPKQYREISTGAGTAFVLAVPVEGPNEVPAVSGQPVNTWRYNSSNPVYNRESYDLWADIFIRGKTNRICNWKKTIDPNPQPYP